MDYTPIEHAAIATCIMVLVWFATNDALAGAMAGSWFFIGREHSEAEYRWMDLHKVSRDGRESLGAFSPAVWTIGSMLDWIAPALACATLWALTR